MIMVVSRRGGGAGAAEASWPEITAAARELFPGGRLRRRFFWRYSLLSHRPMSGQKAGELPVTPV